MDDGMVSICPCCGYDMENDKPAEFGGIAMFPYGNARFCGSEIKLTPGEAAVLWALVKAKGRPLSRAVLAERKGYEGLNNVVDVMLTRIKHKLAAHGDVPIRNIRAVGVYIEEPQRIAA